MTTVTLILLAGLPLALYLWLMWRMDRYDREPVGLVLLVFGWGALGAIAVTLIINQGLLTGFGEDPASPFHAWRVAAGAPLIEEPAKALIFLWLTKHPDFDNVTDGFVYGAAAGLGFALTENISYFITVSQTGAPHVLAGTIIVRTLYSTLLHAGATSLVGAAFGLAKFRRRHQAKVLPWVGLGAAVLMHAVWNGLLVMDKVTGGGGAWTLLDFALFPVEFLVLFLLFQKCIRFEEGLLVRTLAEEVPQDQLALISNYRHHHRVEVPEGVPRKEYLRTITRLAFRKEQAMLIDDPVYHAEVDYWRDRLRLMQERT